MTVTVEVPERLVAEAESRGVPVEEVVRERLRADLQNRRPHKKLSPDFDWNEVPGAVQRIRENGLRSTLGTDVKIRQLIEEGRRY